MFVNKLSNSIINYLIVLQQFIRKILFFRITVYAEVSLVLYHDELESNCAVSNTKTQNIVVPASNFQISKSLW